MTWEYALVGLVFGILIGAVAMRFGNRKLRQQQALKYELDKSQTELEKYRQELIGHFAYSAELIDNMARDYRQLYQHIAQSSNKFLLNLPNKGNPFCYQLTEAEADNDQAPVVIPCDYAKGTSGLLHVQVPRRD